MVIDKVINNNLVRAFDKNKKEVLVMGCGLGFKKKPGEIIDSEKVEKVYTIEDTSASNRLAVLLSKIPLNHIQTTNEIISYARCSLGKQLNDNIYLTLTDHLSFAVERFEKGVILKNALLWEIKKFYNHEYLIGKESLEIIHKRLGVCLPEDEAGFIALHIVNAESESPGMEKTTDMTKMIHDILNIVKYHFSVELDEYSLHYERFLTHLKFFAQRVFNGTEIQGEDNSFMKVIKEQYKNEYDCALKIRDYVSREYIRTLTEDELIYLTVHIKRVTTE